MGSLNSIYQTKVYNRGTIIGEASGSGANEVNKHVAFTFNNFDSSNDTTRTHMINEGKIDLRAPISAGMMLRPEINQKNSNDHGGLKDVYKRQHDKEGRVITLEFEKFYMVTVYTPNSKDELLRLDYRMIWEDEFRKYLKNLEKKKPVVVCGDLNVAHKEIDLKNPKTNRRNAGFTDEERGKFTELLDSGFIDTFRYFYPNLEQVYSWWSYRGRARENNACLLYTSLLIFS